MFWQEKEGWLSKRGKRGWQRRYFVVHADGGVTCTREPLHRYAESEGDERRESHIANMLHAKAVGDLPNSAKQYVFTVVLAPVFGKTEELILAADSAREKKEWMEALNSWLAY